MFAVHALKKTRLISRHGTEYTDSKRFAAVRDQIEDAASGLDVVFQGEIVGVIKGRHNLGTIWTPGAKIMYYIFDILEVDGVPLVGKQWSARNEILDTIFQPQSNVERCPSDIDGELIEPEARRLGLEGVVSKHHRGIYTQGRRTSRAVKYKFPEYTRD
jgi:ATP-dependent DNA ligase